MTDSQRNIGGINPRNGNRCQDAFAAFRCLELAAKVLTEGTLITLEERPSPLSWQTLSDGSETTAAPPSGCRG
ncbi:hypothetical protein [Tuwongella immobilis]|uniref:Uncharacterized protein n=1 Tax=Tuwongella immobilis TaxID=692036 RepID=A0A6C2YW80_9BACT|nr:hypothetical protein [Tuwongella immobilis]VIP05122.1 unnamed protein product [Tuwongella immobilis]VTS07600.1 unnamed protein product [Tuwongella immobilis]